MEILNLLPTELHKNVLAFAGPHPIGDIFNSNVHKLLKCNHCSFNNNNLSLSHLEINRLHKSHQSIHHSNYIVNTCDIIINSCGDRELYETYEYNIEF